MTDLPPEIVAAVDEATKDNAETHVVTAMTLETTVVVVNGEA